MQRHSYRLAWHSACRLTRDADARLPTPISARSASFKHWHRNVSRHYNGALQTKWNSNVVSYLCPCPSFAGSIGQIRGRCGPMRQLAIRYNLRIFVDSLFLRKIPANIRGTRELLKNSFDVKEIRSTCTPVSDTMRYYIQEFNVDWKAECNQLNLEHVTKTKIRSQAVARIADRTASQ